MSARFDTPFLGINNAKPRLLVIGGQFSGTFCCRELRRDFDITLVDAKEYMEFTPGILRAFVHPSHFDSLSFCLQPVMAKMAVTFLAGEVKQLSFADSQVSAEIKALVRNESAHVESGGILTLSFDYCVICSGCNFGPFEKWGESLWFPTIHEAARQESAWPEIDERYLEGRRRHILEEHEKLAVLNERQASILVVGAGFIGVEWVTELQHFFPKLKLTIVDVLPRCLGPLPERAAKYCERYMTKVGIQQVYDIKYDPASQAFWDQIGLPMKAERTFVCIGVKASNYFMPAETLSVRGPGGGGWIHFNQKLQVTLRPSGNEPLGETWAEGRVFAVGDCNYGCIGNPPDWIMPPVPKVSFPSEEQAAHACASLRVLAGSKPKELKNTYWPWGAGMFVTSLGPRDACFVLGASHQKGSGYMVNWWLPAAWQKELIERTKIMECRDSTVGRLVWHFVHHRPFLQ
ncbi:unnamed protein product [Durusdinium trenchii]|uniref:FAD/NAD(P)-binding domain-containing protein n=2 Tax=Durusdinium trenchii TaxID=1381693 RepID=A0ABP0SSX1_9DINO